MLTVNVVFLHNVGIQPHHTVEGTQMAGFVMDGVPHSEQLHTLWRPWFGAVPMWERARRTLTQNVRKLKHIKKLMSTIATKTVKNQNYALSLALSLCIWLYIKVGISLSKSQPKQDKLYNQVVSTSPQVQNSFAYSQSTKHVRKCNGRIITLWPIVCLYA